MNRLSPLAPLSILLVAVVAVAAGGQPTKRLSDWDRGKELYDRHCIQCHGATTAGDGPAAAALVAEVPDLRGKLEAADLDANARLVLDGEGAMPGFETSFDRYDARRTLKYMDRLGRDEPMPFLSEEGEEPQKKDDGPDEDAAE